MTTDIPEDGYRRYGLYYPYFNVRDQDWLKVAALYWPKIVRLVPDDYEPHLPESADTVAARARDAFLVRQPPGPSVGAVAPRMLDLLATYGSELRDCLSPFSDHNLFRPAVATLHENQLAPEVRAALIDAGLALCGADSWERSSIWRYWAELASGTLDFPGTRNSGWYFELMHGQRCWVLMPERLVAVYTSVLAEDFATANQLNPTTDQDSAYAVTNNWTTDRIAVALLDRPAPAHSPAQENLTEALAFLALGLVIPADLRAVPFEKIMEIRERYGAEFLAFGRKVDQVVAKLSELSDVRDQAVLDQYLHDVVSDQFAAPLTDLRQKMKCLTGDAAVASINIKTELPIAAVGGGHGYPGTH
ncbi:hypothetical protein SHJG_p1126 (plasmid) [Streptomyces hygroscopicus subsp. jinggangensis 5008]|nr:hypothetical protein SHJG_p1126 [Streptomyces hygroscopicus subsp. jinggangensis 5008]AGF68411.1 hypothetical protein SHJGH_p1126 [Streptomyces hygroscopicus subsp. jinggangensis TL01]